MREREPEVEALRTKLARKFTSLADEVNECFEGFHIGGGDYVVELLAPEGVSTGGGKQALQHLRLRPRRPGFSVIVAGSTRCMLPVMHRYPSPKGISLWCAPKKKRPILRGGQPVTTSIVSFCDRLVEPAQPRLAPCPVLFVPAVQ